MNEAETRAEHIDPALKAAGWGVVEGSRVLREFPLTPGRIEGHGRRARSHQVDYVLVFRNRKLGVVEAKAWDKRRAKKSPSISSFCQVSTRTRICDLAL